MVAISEVTAIVLTGGKGTRLAGLYPGLPKPMVPVCGKPFLHWVTAWLVRQRLRDIVYSTGHLAGQVETWANKADFGAGVRLRCRRETAALGTGGAIANCLDLGSDPILALNGDSLVLASLASLAARLDDPSIDGVIQGVVAEDAARYGTLELGGDGLLSRFLEKRPGRGVVNAGLYLMRRRLFPANVTPGPSSMETNLLPAALACGARIAVEVTAQAPFLDIGTPDSVVLAEAFITRHFAQFQTT
ncbi:MAG: sugar phosphate nucleotidyltransferase [Pseudolabrys sp.]